MHFMVTVDSLRYVGLPLTFTWPHLRCDVGIEDGQYWIKNCLCVRVLCIVSRSAWKFGNIFWFSNFTR